MVFASITRNRRCVSLSGGPATIIYPFATFEEETGLSTKVAMIEEKICDWIELLDCVGKAPEVKTGAATS